MFQNITMSSQTRAFTLASFPSKYCDSMTLEVAKASEEIRTGTQLKCGVCLHLLMEQVAGASWSPAALISVKIGFCRLAQLSLCRCVSVSCFVTAGTCCCCCCILLISRLSPLVCHREACLETFEDQLPHAAMRAHCSTTAPAVSYTCGGFLSTDIYYNLHNTCIVCL